jgi:ribosomal protein RSM22 (predicted rRNA methylase)
VVDALAGLGSEVDGRRLGEASERLSAAYRRSGPGMRIAGGEELAGYAAVRFPATYAAAAAAFRQVAARRLGWRPTTLLDVGSGLGATVAAAAAVWPGFTSATCVEVDPRVATVGPAVARAAGVADVRWLTQDARRLPAGSFDLVTAGYVLNELDPGAAGEVAAAAWAATAGILVLVEPGRPAEYRALLHRRSELLAAGAKMVAPCPHERPCPLAGDDWCHFGQRLARTVAHREAKGATLAYEDEKYSYLAVARTAPREPAGSRVLRRPLRRKGVVLLRLCTPDGEAVDRVVPRSGGDGYRIARQAEWGAEIPLV